MPDRDAWWRHEQYVSLTMEFRCNLRCRHCMIEGTMDSLRPVSREEFRRVLAARADNGWKGLILTGSEITLLRDLAALAREARDAGFRHVRIQTHGMRLSDPDYVRELVSAGVDEFFVSVAAAEALAHDEITGVAGSFAKTLQGLRNLEQHDVLAMTNTVVTTRSVAQLPDLVTRLAGLRRLRHMEFWNYFPMAETDPRGLVAPLRDIVPALRGAIARAEALGRRVEVKNLPFCVMGEAAGHVVNAQPELVIDDAFWQQFARNGFQRCPHRAACMATDCLGLSAAHLDRHPGDAALLSPISLNHERMKDFTR